MKYGPNGERLITKIDRISKPGRRIYRGYKELKPVLGGMGIQILTRPAASSATAGPAPRRSAARSWRWCTDLGTRQRPPPAGPASGQGRQSP